MSEKPMEAEVTKMGCLDMQVCVPKDWTDEQVTALANSKNPCGTDGGWVIRKEGDRKLAGSSERNPCANRPGFVHITLDA